MACRCNALVDVPPHEWPGVLPALVRLIGARATLRLVARFGGQDRFMIPSSVTTRHAWRDLLAPDEWRKVVKEFRGERLSLPRGAFVINRKALIIDLRQKGVPHREIALRAGVTERYVRIVLRGVAT